MTFADIVDIFLGLIAQALPLVGTLALLFFLWGGVQIIRNTGNAEVLAEGKKRIFYGVFALFVMLSIWGILAILKETFFR
jgi:hypothetical protein